MVCGKPAEFMERVSQRLIILDLSVVLDGPFRAEPGQVDELVGGNREVEELTEFDRRVRIERGLRSVRRFATDPIDWSRC